VILNFELRSKSCLHVWNEPPTAIESSFLPDDTPSRKLSEIVEIVYQFRHHEVKRKKRKSSKYLNSVIYWRTWNVQTRQLKSHSALLRLLLNIVIVATLIEKLRSRSIWPPNLQNSVVHEDIDAVADESERPHLGTLKIEKTFSTSNFFKIVRCLTTDVRFDYQKSKTMWRNCCFQIVGLAGYSTWSVSSM
jgi:hypothetical protein